MATTGMVCPYASVREESLEMSIRSITVLYGLLHVRTMCSASSQSGQSDFV